MQPLRSAVPIAGLAFLVTACDGVAPTDVPAPHFSHVADVATGRAQMRPANQSGVQGVIDFTDDGVDLTVTGNATGLIPDVVYVSLIYDNGSLVGGPEACEPTIFDPTDPDFLLPTMFVGVWDNHGDGTGALSEVNVVDDETGERVYVSLDRFRTISIRNTSINGGFGPAAVAACGREATHPAG